MAPAKKKTAAKKAAKSQPLKDSIQRVHGATVFTMRNVDEKTATSLVADHGFRLGQRTDDGATLFADKVAFDSWKANP
tara:strand:- start:106 stop:339 length:234 start_codon:yes stop_codon:yes gene_type:complete